MILRVAGLNPTLRRARVCSRAGFTLIEILLATLIAALLLTALYAAMSMTLQQTQSSRDAVEAEDLARGVFTKITIDLSGTLAPLPPKSGGNSAASGGTTATPSAGTTPTDGSTATADPAASATSSTPTTATPSTTTPTDGSTDPTMPGATDNATALTAAPMFQGGVVGQEQMLILFLGKTPEAFGRYGEQSQQVRGDQRQVIYKFVTGRGLYRVERPWITADNLTLDLDPDAPDSVLLAEEVVDALFEYTDGTDWASTWDGTAPGPDGVTPLGPPRAVRVTLTFSIASSRGQPMTRQVSQIIVVRAAPGTFTPPLLEAPTDGASNTTPSDTTSSDTTTGGTTTGGATTGGTTGGTTTPGTSTGGKTPTVPSGGKLPSLPSGGSLPSLPSGGSMPSVPSGGSIPSGGGKTGGTGGRTGGGK